MKPEEKAVIDSNNDKASYYYCFNNKDANISLHEDIVIKVNNAAYIYAFAKNIKGANINKLEEAIIKSNNVDCIYAFAKNIKGANINKLEEAIIKINDSDYIYDFARDIKGANLDNFKDILENSKYKEEFAKLYSEYKKNKMNKEEQEVLAKNDPEASYEYCKNNEEANISLHEDIICKSNKVHYIYCFARYIEGANISNLEEAIVKINYAPYIYSFAKDIKGANINKLEEAIIKTNNADYIYHFAVDIKGANLDKFKDILENSIYKKEFVELYSEYKKNKKDTQSEISSSNFNCDKSSHEPKKESIDSSNVNYFTKNLIEGAYAGITTVAIDNIKKVLIASVKAAGANEVSLNIISMFLDSLIGNSIISMLIGIGIKLIPIDYTQDNVHIQKIGEKCIQNVGSDGVQYAFNFATTFILPALLNAIQDNKQINLLNSINAADKVRVPQTNQEEAFDIDTNNLIEGIFSKASLAV